MKRKNTGITLIALIITIIIMLILAGVTISIVGGSDGLIAKAEKAVSETDKAAMQEDAELAIATIKMEYYEDYATNKNKTAKEFIVAKLQDAPYETSRGATMVADSDGNITYTLNEKVMKVSLDEDGKVSMAEKTLGDTYYGVSDAEPAAQKYFTFEINEDGQTATLTGIKDEYAELSYYKQGETVYSDYSLKCVINDNGNYITDVAIPYEYVDENNNKYVVTSIGDSAFGPDNEFGWITSVAWNSSYEIKEKMFTSFTIPNTVTNIGQYAFSSNPKMTQIKISDSVISIGTGAFEGCTSLSSINIPESVTSIGIRAFSDCTSLSSINIPESVTSIGWQAFSDCASLARINIPSSVTSIEYGVFSGCTSLSSINIPDGVTSIGSSAFSGCTGLSSINIPSSVTTIGQGAFDYWTESQTINCEILEVDKPSGWNAKWDYYDSNTARKATLNWGVSM